MQITGSTATLVGAGAGATITASAARTTGFESATSTVTLATILPQPVTVRVSTVTRAPGSATTPLPTLSATGLVLGDALSDLGTPTFSGTGTTSDATTPIGTYPITVTFSPPNPNYTISVIDGSLRIVTAVDLEGNPVDSAGSRGCGAGGTGLALVVLFLLLRSPRPTSARRS